MIDSSVVYGSEARYGGGCKEWRLRNHHTSRRRSSESGRSHCPVSVPRHRRPGKSRRRWRSPCFPRPVCPGRESAAPIPGPTGEKWSPLPRTPSARGSVAVAADPEERTTVGITRRRRARRGPWGATSAGPPYAGRWRCGWRWRWQPSAERSAPHPTPRAPERVAGVGNLHQHRLDHRHVGGNRAAIVQESRILHLALAVVDVFLAQRPSRYPALHRPGSGPRRSWGGSPCRRPGSRCSARS